MRSIKQLEYLVIHHSASPAQTTTIDDIRVWHQHRGFYDIGYHYVVDAAGNVHTGRSVPFEGAHTLGFNDRSLGVCLVGNNVSPDPNHHWTRAQRDTLLRIAGFATVVAPQIKIVGHRDLVETTECPGVDVKTWLEGPK